MHITISLVSQLRAYASTYTRSLYTYLCMYTCMQYTRHEYFYVCTRCSHLSSKSVLFVFILGAMRCARALRLGWDEDSAAAVAAQDDSPRRSATPPSAERRAGVPAILFNSG